MSRQDFTTYRSCSHQSNLSNSCASFTVVSCEIGVLGTHWPTRLLGELTSKFLRLGHAEAFLPKMCRMMTCLNSRCSSNSRKLAAGKLWFRNLFPHNLSGSHLPSKTFCTILVPDAGAGVVGARQEKRCTVCV